MANEEHLLFAKFSIDSSDCSASFKEYELVECIVASHTFLDCAIFTAGNFCFLYMLHKACLSIPFHTREGALKFALTGYNV